MCKAPWSSPCQGIWFYPHQSSRIKRVYNVFFEGAIVTRTTLGKANSTGSSTFTNKPEP